MGSKNRKEEKKRKGGGKSASLTKLSNKRLNKLAKQGKLKKRLPKKELIKLLKEKTTGETELEVTDLKEEVKKPHKDEEEDIPIAEADYDYFATPGRNYDFLSNAADRLDKVEKKRKRKISEEDEEDYEKVPRKGQYKPPTKALLPIKSTQHGIIARSEEYEKQEGEEEEEQDTAEKEPEQVEPERVLTAAEQMYQQEKKMQDLKERISSLCTAVIEAPQENTRNLKELRLILETDDRDIRLQAMRLGMVSLTMVYQDIVPAYRIRPPTEAEKQQAVKKDTKALRDFEESLLGNYRHFLEYLEALASGRKPKTRDKEKRKKPQGVFIPAEHTRSLMVQATKCLCELLLSHPHFNFRTNIISVVVPLATAHNAELSDMVCGYIKRLFKADQEGSVSLEVTRLIGRIVKNKKYNVHPKVLNTFLALKIKEIEKEEEKKAEPKKQDRGKLSRRERKKKKQMVDLEKELEEAGANVDKKKRLKIHTEIITQIFLTYVRILKLAQDSGLISAVLEGLAKFAHLINVDFFDDLFTLLNDLVDSQTLSALESLHCVSAAFTILSGAGVALNVDPHRFYRHLYRVLLGLRTGAEGDLADVMPLALHCLHVLVTKRRKQISHQRILGFIKRIMCLALQLPTNGIVGCLATIRNFIHAETKSDLLFDTEHMGNGVYQPELDDPEHCNAHNSALYETHLLQHHFHPVVREYSEHIMAGAPSGGVFAATLGRRSPTELFELYDDSEMLFTPPPETKPRGGKNQTKASVNFRDGDFQAYIDSTSAAISSPDISTMDIHSNMGAASHTALQNGAMDIDDEEEDEEEEVDEDGLTETEKVLLSLVIEQEVEEEEEKEDKVEEKKSKYEKKLGGKPGKAHFTNKHFKNRRNRRRAKGRARGNKK